MANQITWIELPSTDPAATQKFYHDVFGWKTANESNDHYAEFLDTDRTGGGIYKVDKMPIQGGIVPYVQVEDIEKMIAEVAEHGGTPVTEKQQIPDGGHIIHFNDPAGNKVGLYEPKK